MEVLALDPVQADERRGGCIVGHRHHKSSEFPSRRWHRAPAEPLADAALAQRDRRVMFLRALNARSVGSLAVRFLKAS